MVAKFNYLKEYIQRGEAMCMLCNGDDFTHMPNPDEITVRCNKIFPELPLNSKVLKLDGCISLRSLPKLPETLEILVCYD